MNTGIFGEGFPYSNFHDLNMDWIIKIAKDFLDQYTHIQDIIEQGKTDINNMTEEGLSELQTKYETLEGLLQAWYNTHSSDIANQLTEALADLNSWYTTHQNYLDQTLIAKTATFNQMADAKIQEALSSLPSDYSDTVTEVSNISNYLQFVKLILGAQYLNTEYFNLPKITPASFVNGQAHKIDGNTGSGSDYSYARFNNISSDNTIL